MKTEVITRYPWRKPRALFGCVQNTVKVVI